MREIKFRAWDNISDKWDYFTLDNLTTYIEVLNFHTLNGHEFYLYVGLKDKSGAEIYEGDTLEYADYAGSHKTTVEWDNKAAGFDPFIWNVSDQPTLMNNDIRVIGNIYENKELLK